MVMGALEKLIRGTAWGSLDVLFVDMPPGKLFHLPSPDPQQRDASYVFLTKHTAYPWL